MIPASLWNADNVDQTNVDETEVLNQSLAILDTLADPSARQPEQDLRACWVETCAGVIINFWDGECGQSRHFGSWSSTSTMQFPLPEYWRVISIDGIRLKPLHC